jgi:hypothetical protein
MSKPPERYYLVEDSDYLDFQKEINYMLQEGWQLHGSTFAVTMFASKLKGNNISAVGTTKIIYHQAMYREQQ